MSVSLAAAFLGLSMSACDERLTAPSLAAELVKGSPWKLHSMERPGAGVVRAPDPSRFTLQLSEQGGVAVVADCNRCNGSYTIGAARVSIPTLACTRAFCTTAPFDTDYGNVLSGESAVTFGQATLTLSSTRGTLQFGR